MKTSKRKVRRWIKEKTMFFKLVKRGISSHGLKYLKSLLSFECFSCGDFSLKIRTRRQNTAYVDDIQNYTHECQNCHIEHESYWQDRWDEYYGSI